MPDGIEKLVEQEKPNAFTMLMDDVQTDPDSFSSALQTAANVIRWPRDSRSVLCNEL
jgi:hypothetical protein